MRGKGGPENTICKYRGVRQISWGKWVSEICMPNHGERIWIGTFNDSKAAALAYDEAAIRMFGATAKLNFSEMSLPVHTTASTSTDAIDNQRHYGDNDMPNFLEKLIEMQHGEFPPGDEVTLIANPYACLINDHLYDYHGYSTVEQSKLQCSNVMKNDEFQKANQDDNQEKMEVELPEHGGSSTSFSKIKDLGVDIAGKSEYVGNDDLEEDLGSINIWF
ncbi:hypothetical protein POM88_014079 [Heracleum sosnowskyi]|uniref:AP2/ERF domain-containing protein n=1 Tax=Heracleum sosnowskyi TaxID=360622 RepID=A0AAD8J1T7_9APIA|nr:hypothetical protein POM88_014079 [Heracleum sosnowskyi]